MQKGPFTAGLGGELLELYHGLGSAERPFLWSFLCTSGAMGEENGEIMLFMIHAPLSRSRWV